MAFWKDIATDISHKAAQAASGSSNPYLKAAGGLLGGGGGSGPTIVASPPPPVARKGVRRVQTGGLAKGFGPAKIAAIAGVAAVVILLWKK